MQRVKKRLEIKNRLGLHARASALLVQTINRFSCEVKISKDDQVVNGRSIIGVLTLGAAKGTKIRVEARGDDAQEALAAIKQLVENKFGEGE
jgi:phosphocarrier protein HPr